MENLPFVALKIKISGGNYFQTRKIIFWMSGLSVFGGNISSGPRNETNERTHS